MFDGGVKEGREEGGEQMSLIAGSMLAMGGAILSGSKECEQLEIFV